MPLLMEGGADGVTGGSAPAPVGREYKQELDTAINHCKQQQQQQ